MFLFNKVHVPNYWISCYAIYLASHISDNRLCSAEHIYSQSYTVIILTLSSVSSASARKVSINYPGLTRHEFGQQNSLKVPIIKFHKNVSTWSRVVPCKWAYGPVDTFCNYFGNISGRVTFFAFNRCIVLFGIYCMHCVAYMWECCWAFNTSGQRSGYIHCSAWGPRTSFMHVLLLKRG